MEMVLIFIYWATFIMCVATYFVYPAVIIIFGKISPLKINKGPYEPRISILISAYNEERDIAEKIANTLALHYPREKMEILVGSDGSSDETVRVARACGAEQVSVFDFPKNRGKTSVQNDLAAAATGDILIFTDAASFLRNDAVLNIVRNFLDPRVGCVAGRMRFVNTDENVTTQSQGLYWRYEVKIREMESALGSLVGVDGPLYAVRRECYVPLETQAISDLLTPLLVLERGKKVILEREATVDEAPTTRTAHEFNTRRRITLRGLTGLAIYRRLLNPLRHPGLSLQIFFHKVLRWFVGPIVIFHVISCAMLSSFPFFRWALFLYLIFFGAAYCGWYVDRIGRKNRIFTIPYYFSLINVAATMGIVDFFRKKQANSWKPVRD